KAPRSRFGLRGRLGADRRGGETVVAAAAAYRAGAEVAARLPVAARDGQALPDERVRADPPRPRGAGPAPPPGRRHLLPDARRAAAPGGRRRPVGADRGAPAPP